jgi:hypothetical protein
VKSTGEESPAVKNIKQQTKDLIERNDKLSQEIVGINGYVMPKITKLKLHFYSANLRMDMIKCALIHQVLCLPNY